MESITRPFFHHRRKLSNLNNTSSNGMSFSGKDSYDDVLLGAPKSKLAGVAASRGVVALEDYAEIFGGGGAGVGTVKQRGSSIPVLDLSELDKANGLYDSRCLNGKLDYSKIFGSFAGDVDDEEGLEGTGVFPPYEDLFGGVKKHKRDKAKKARNPPVSVTKSPPKGSDSVNSSEASDPFLDGGKQLNMSYHKTSQRNTDGQNGTTTHIAQLHAVPGFTYFIDEAAVHPQQKAEHDKPFPRVKTDAIHSRTSSGELSEGKPSRRGKWQLPPDRLAFEGGVVNSKDDNGWSEVAFKPYASNVPVPSSSSANSNEDQGHPKRVKSSSFVAKSESLEKNSNGYSSNSDEELDVNSAAAVSAAALKKAIQQAQESIRLAKELMERKKDPIQSSKPCVNGSFKVKDKKEIKYDENKNVYRKNNTEEARKAISSDASGFDQKITKGSDEIASGRRCSREDLSTDRKIDTEKCKPIAEVTDEQGVGTWFSQMLNNGKSKMAALASQLVDTRNTISQPASKHMHGAEETVPDKGTLGRGTPPDMEEDVLGKVPDQFVQAGTRSEALMSSQKDQINGFHCQEKSEKKEQDCEKTTTCNVEPEILENGCSPKELKKEEESFELGIRRTAEGFCAQKGNEQKLKEVTTIGSSEKKQESFSRNRLEGYHQEDICEQSSSKGENVCEDIDQIPKTTNQHEGSDISDVPGNDDADNENIKVNPEDVERYDTEGEPDESKENLGASLFPEAVNEENSKACKIDNGTTREGASEDSEVRETSKQSRPLESTISEEDDDDEIGAKEDEKESEQSVEETSVVNENNMSETSSLDHNVPQEHVLESRIQVASEALDSDDNTKDFGLDTSFHEQRLSTDTEYDVENETATEAPTVGESTSDCEFADISGEKEEVESDEEYEVSITPENLEGLAHESAEETENMKEDDVTCEVGAEKLEPDCEAKESEEDLETNRETRPDQNMENYEENICRTSSVKEEKESRAERVQKEAKEKDSVKRIEIENQREREREKDRIAVERAIREARKRAFADARERAGRAAVERANAEVRQRAMAGAREKIEKLSAGPKASTDKATTEAKLRAERAAVERATAEARERALDKALSQKSTNETRTQVDKVGAGKSSGLKHSFSSSDLEGTGNESAQRRKARLERHQRIMERAAKALAEKNMRDILAQREQAERNRLAETLDADIKRWASGKEGNLRALLSTLQYILGPDSGWQSMSLTEIITTNAVKKAYRKATLYVHPDKLQQRGASIQQKYICEKVFDLLKAAWNRFNSEER